LEQELGSKQSLSPTPGHVTKKQKQKHRFGKFRRKKYNKRGENEEKGETKKSLPPKQASQKAKQHQSVFWKSELSYPQPPPNIILLK
jgi:hypothetical protein